MCLFVLGEWVLLNNLLLNFDAIAFTKLLNLKLWKFV